MPEGLPEPDEDSTPLHYQIEVHNTAVGGYKSYLNRYISFVQYLYSHFEHGKRRQFLNTIGTRTRTFFR